MLTVHIVDIIISRGHSFIQVDMWAYLLPSHIEIHFLGNLIQLPKTTKLRNAGLHANDDGRKIDQKHNKTTTAKMLSIEFHYTPLQSQSALCPAVQQQQLHPD